MKIKKPEDEKYFKDIVLNGILEEISKETGAKMPRSSSFKKEKKISEKNLKKTIFFTFITLIFVVFLFLLFKVISDATKEKPLIPNSHKKTSKTNNNQTWKMEEDRANFKTLQAIQKKEKQALHTTKKRKNLIEMNTLKQKPKKRKKTERELAKEALRQQMLR